MSITVQAPRGPVSRWLERRRAVFSPTERRSVSPDRTALDVLAGRPYADADQ